jgi:hypothetical protein
MRASPNRIYLKENFAMKIKGSKSEMPKSRVFSVIFPTFRAKLLTVLF